MMIANIQYNRKKYLNFVVILLWIIFAPLVMSIENEREFKFSTKITNIMKQAWIHYSKGEHKKAKSIIVEQANKKDISLAILSGTIYWKQGECGKALGDLNLVKSSFDDYFKLSDFQNADKGKKSIFTKEELSDILKYHYTPLYFVSAYCNYSMGNWNESIFDLNKYLEVKPDDAVMRQYLGTSYAMLKKYNEAKVAYDKAYGLLIKENSKSTKARLHIRELILVTLYNQVIINFKLGDINAAKKFLHRVYKFSNNKKKLFEDMSNDQDYKKIMENKEMLIVMKRYLAQQ